MVNSFGKNSFHSQWNKIINLWLSWSIILEENKQVSIGDIQSEFFYLILSYISLKSSLNQKTASNQKKINKICYALGGSPNSGE